jgi:hypothetical protein
LFALEYRRQFACIAITEGDAVVDGFVQRAVFNRLLAVAVQYRGGETVFLVAHNKNPS